MDKQVVRSKTTPLILPKVDMWLKTNTAMLKVSQHKNALIVSVGCNALLCN